jgi:hypothetical protein
LLGELRRPPRQATIVYCDNISAVYLSGNPVQHRRTKHVEIDLHFVLERVSLGDVGILHVPTTSQYADIFTKGLPSVLFSEFRTSLNIVEDPVATAGGGVGLHLTVLERQRQAQAQRLQNACALRPSCPSLTPRALPTRDHHALRTLRSHDLQSVVTR